MAVERKQVDYDQVAPTYDHRYHTNRLPGVEAVLLTLTQECMADCILEVGCGTGHWIAGLSSAAPQVFGLDLSIGMLQKAQCQLKTGNLVCGLGEQLPFEYECFDLVYCVNALHHFRDPVEFISTSWASLKPGGCLVIIGQVPQDQTNRWFVYDYFEGTYETDIQRFHTWDAVKGWMLKARFEIIRLEPVEYIRDHKIGSGVLEDPFLDKNATSQLALLSDQEYDQGIQRIQDAILAAELKGETLTFPVELRLDMLMGRKGNLVQDKDDPIIPSITGVGTL